MNQYPLPFSSKTRGGLDVSTKLKIDPKLDCDVHSQVKVTHVELRFRISLDHC